MIENCPFCLLKGIESECYYGRYNYRDEYVKEVHCDAAGCGYVAGFGMDKAYNPTEEELIAAHNAVSSAVREAKRKSDRAELKIKKSQEIVSGVEVRRWYKSKKMTQEKLRIETGLSHGHMWNILNEKFPATKARLRLKKYMEES